MRAFLSFVLAACLAGPAHAAEADVAAIRQLVQQFQAAIVAHSDKAIEERFYDVRIDTNGTVASVWFDFDFLESAKVTNRGSETWQLVHTIEGWKIQAMLYSAHP